MFSLKYSQQRFDTTFAEYQRTCKKLPAETTNKAGFEVAKICTKTTPFVSKDVIRASLDKPSRISNSLRVCELLANLVQKGSGGKVFTGNKLRIAGDKYKSNHAGGSKFLIAGWIPAIKQLAPIVGKSAGSTSAAKGRPKGGSKAANNGVWNAKTSIWNSVQGGFKPWPNAPARNIRNLQAKIEKGLGPALDIKEADMKVYLRRKADEAARKFNNS